MDDEFKTGDKVRYIGTWASPNLLTTGKIYHVLSIKYDSYNKLKIKVMCDDGQTTIYLYPLTGTTDPWFEKVENIVKEIDFLDILKGY